MTPDAFNRWLAEMQASGKARNESDCARALDHLPKNLHRLKQNGGDKRLALACAALLHGLRPYE